MAQYLVPKFIEKKPTIIGPMTFRQFVYIGIAGLISAVLFFVLPLWYTIIVSVILFGVAIALAFYTIGGKTLPSILWHSVKFYIKPKVYLWKKKRSSPKIIRQKEEEPKKEEKEKGIPLKVVGSSRLKETETKVKTWKK